jgi:hypothetical protein
MCATYYANWEGGWTVPRVCPDIMVKRKILVDPPVEYYVTLQARIFR